tara:strand:+ start:2882 stop:5395 length:2514 start_codon:yes stop_codon:yes gene_type:complete
MAKYELPKYQSMYVDPQSVAINTELRQRFVSSFAADDALQGSVDAMDAADFGGDQAAKQRFADQYNDGIRTRAERADYETLGMSINRDARNFIKDYTPIQRNKKRYDDAMASLDEAEKLGVGKPGGIDGTTKQKLKEFSVYNEEGLQYDENGNFIEDSYFKAPGFVGEVDEYELMKEEMSDFVAREGYKDLGTEIPVDRNGRPLIENGIINGVPRYWMTTKSGREYIDPESVLKVTERVLNRADVKGAYNQRARLDTYKNDEIVDDQGTTKATALLDGQDASLEDAINMLNQKGGALTADETKELNELETQLNDLRANRESDGDMATVTQQDLNNKINSFRQSNIDKYAYDKYEGGRTFEDDKEYMDGASENPENNQSIATISEAAEVPAIGGNTTESITGYYQEKEDAINSTLDYFSKLKTTDGQLLNISSEETLDDLLTLNNFGPGDEGVYGEDIQALAKKYNMSPALFIDKAKQTQIQKQKQLLVQQRRKETELEVFKTDDYNAKISEEYETLGVEAGNFNVTGVGLKNSLVNLGLIDKDASVKDAFDYYTTNQKNPTGNFAGATGDDTLLNTVLNQLAVDNNTTLIPKKDLLDVTADESAIRSLADNYRERIAKDNKEIDDYYNANVKTDTGWKMKNFGDKENTVKVQKAFKNVFDDPSGFLTVPIYHPDREKVYDNNDNEIPYTIGQYMDDQSKLGINNITVNSDNISLSSVVRADGTSIINIPVTLENGEIINLTANAAGIKNEALTAWTSSAEYEAGKLWQMGVQANLPEGKFTPELLDGIVFDYKNNQVIVKGTPMKISEGLQIVANMLDRANYAKSTGKDQSEFFNKL